MSKIIDVECLYKLSENCKTKFQLWKQDAVKNKTRNDGNIKCVACARHDLALKVANKSYFEIIDTELKAYMLGVIAGDGALSKYTLHIVAQPLDIETLKLFQMHVSLTSKIKKIKFANCYYIAIHSLKMVQDICKHLNINPGKKCDKISIPNLSDDLLWHFIRGLVDTDGSISNLIASKRSFPICSYASKSEKIKDQLIALCKDIKYTSDDIQVIFNGINAIKFMDKIYNNANIYLTRKHVLYIIAKTWIPQKGSPFRPRKTRKDKGIKKCQV